MQQATPASDHEVAVIRAMKDQGYINEEIGKALGRTGYSVGHICKRHGIRVNRSNYEKRRKMREERYSRSTPPEAVRPLMSEEEIAKLYDGQRYEDVPERALRLEEKRRLYWYDPSKHGRRATKSASSSMVSMMEAAE